MHQFLQILQCISSQHTPLCHRVILNSHNPPEQNQCLPRHNAFPDTMPMNHANISKEDKVINEHVHKLTNTPPQTKRVTKSKLSFLGHSIRKSKDGPIQQ